MSINPRRLEKWDSSKEEDSMTKVFESAFSIYEKLESLTNGSGAPMGRNAHFDARQTLAIIAKMMDGKYVRRALVQTKDDEQAMVVDLLSCNGTLVRKRADKKHAPLILARVSYHKKSDLDAGQIKRIGEAVMQSMPKSGAIQSIKAGCPEEIELLLDYFKRNRELLSKDFLQKFEDNLPKKFSLIPDTFTTFISPLFTGDMEGVCNVCGKRSTSVCARCKLVRYCSQKCQSEDWKKDHKTSCVSKSLEAGAEGRCYVEIDPAKLPDNMAYSHTISNHQSFGLGMSSKVVHLKTMINNQPVGELEVLKVQVQLYKKVTDPGVIYVYSKGKKFEMDITVEMCTDGFEGYRRLFEFVKAKGGDCGYGCGGVKLFAHGLVTEDLKLRILTDKALPWQLW